MAEDHEPLQLAFLAESVESQQCAQGFARSWAGEHKHIRTTLMLQPSPQQANQLLLPLSRPKRLAYRPRWKIEANGMDGGSGEDESF